MTVCIAAICSDRQSGASALVVAADRMQTWGATEFENATSKIFPISSATIALVSGEARRGGQIVRDVQAQLKTAGGVQAVVEVATAISAHYVYRRNTELDALYFGARGLSLASFYGGRQREMSDHIASGLDNIAANFNYGVEFLIVGVDQSGAHLTYVGNPGGVSLDWDATGFAAIGAGHPQAMHTMFELGHTPASGVEETMVRVFAAKKRAEGAQGVGATTEFAIVRPAGITPVEPATMAALGGLYDEHRGRMASDLKETAAKLKLT